MLRNAVRQFLVHYHTERNHQSPGVLNYPEDLGPGFFRLSVGLEDAKDLIADLDRGLQAVSAEAAVPRDH